MIQVIPHLLPVARPVVRICGHTAQGLSPRQRLHLFHLKAAVIKLADSDQATFKKLNEDGGRRFLKPLTLLRCMRKTTG